SGGATAIWNTQSWRQEMFITHEKPIFDLTFAGVAERMALATASEEGVELWPLSGDEQGRRGLATDAPVHLLQSSRDGQSSFIACRESPFGMWDVAAARWRWRVQTGPQVQKAAISPDGKFIATVTAS